MGLMAFMEAMGTSNIALVAAFFIGLMTAISPCPLATNITAIAYASKKINNGKHTILVSIFYTLGRMLTYVLIASLIVWFGLSMQAVSFFLQKYGNILLGPILIFVGLVLADISNIRAFGINNKISKIKEKLSGKITLFSKFSNWLESFKEKLSDKGYVGSFLLGVVFALAFCPFSAVLFFGMLIPLALGAKDGILIPAVFAFATGLPVIVFSFLLVFSISKLGKIINKIGILEKWMRKIVAIIFIIIGLYYVGLLVI